MAQKLNPNHLNTVMIPSTQPPMANNTHMVYAVNDTCVASNIPLVPLEVLDVTANGSIKAAVSGSLAKEVDNGSVPTVNGSSTISSLLVSSFLSKLFAALFFTDGNNSIVYMDNSPYH